MNRLRELREERGYSLRELGEKLEMNASVLGNYEREDRQPKIEIWERIAAFFNVTPAYIMGLSPIREATNFFPIDRSTLTSQNKEILDDINEIFEQLIRENNGWTAIQVKTIFENLRMILDLGYLMDEGYSPVDLLVSFSALVKEIGFGDYSKTKDIETFLTNRNEIFHKTDKLFIDNLENN